MIQKIEPLPRRWWLIVLTFVLALIQVGAIMNLVNTPDALADQISLTMPMEMIVAGLWALIFTGVAVNLLWSRTTHLVRWLFIAFATYSTARLLLFARADYDHNRLPFLVVVNVLALLVAFFLRR